MKSTTHLSLVGDDEKSGCIT